MAHLVGSAAGFGDTAHKIAHPTNKKSYLSFLIAEMRGGILCALASDNTLSHIYYGTRLKTNNMFEKY